MKLIRSKIPPTTRTRPTFYFVSYFFMSRPRPPDARRPTRGARRGPASAEETICAPCSLIADGRSGAERSGTERRGTTNQLED